jgi:hypothetical protein
VNSYRGSSQGQAYQGAFADLANEIDAFWPSFFGDAQLTYRSPDIVPVDRAMFTDCGMIAPEPNAFYCPAERTIYLVPTFLVDQEREHGDYAPIAILSHEWGHHVQALLGIVGPTRKAFELQADCLMGAFTRHADELELLDYGDFLEALSTTEGVGDEAILPEDAPGAHGLPEERVKALTRGYGGGPLNGCELPISESEEDSEDRRESPEGREGPGSDDVLDRLLVTVPLTHASCFDIVDDGTEDFGQVLGRFSGVPDAADRLQDWGWQASAFRQFGCDGPPEGEAGWIDISVHQFADSLSAQEAVDYFTAVRLDGSSYIQGVSPGIGDHSTAMSGPAVNGKDFTIYASQGPILVRVTGVSPSGIPFMNVLSVAQAVLADLEEIPQSPSTTSGQEAWRSAASYLPAIPAVHYRDCFDVLDEGTYSYSDVAAALLPTGLSQSQLDGLGWRDGAYVVFTCDEPPAGRAAQIDVGIHQFQDVASAQEALPYFSTMFELGSNHHRDCDPENNLVVCVSARSLTGSPLSDVAFVLQQVVGAAR